MAPPSRIWDAYRTLGITNPNKAGLTCVGEIRHGKRCRWDIPSDDEPQVRSILNKMETKAPFDARPLLKRLGRLTLCEDYHRSQLMDKLKEWEDVIEDAEKFWQRAFLQVKARKVALKMLEKERDRTSQLEQEIARWKSGEQVNIATLVSVVKAEAEAVEENILRQETEKKLQDSQAHAKKMSDNHQAVLGYWNDLIRTSQYKDKEAQTMLEKHAETVKELLDTKHLFSTCQGECEQLRIDINKQNSIFDLNGAELDKLKVNHTEMSTSMEQLTVQVRAKGRTNGRLKAELAQITDERDLSLKEKVDLKTQLDYANGTIDLLKLSLAEEGASSIALSDSRQQLEQELRLENQKLMDLKQSKSQLEDDHAVLAEQELELKSQLSNEQSTSAKLQQSLEDAILKLTSSEDR
ncbi:uncharacterized protein LY89DRAFT_747307 [Mollisia scopiformis]|uniref:Uncharacterized protein n=1 Tax=Mollisia scopiformis TaxID=149040 RepID=A0A194XBT6_MOLSC|nr:uncharacterized protein LY89DRAFT_747307 [Mollisia scopiformis]KUJ17629.1 hypothetical protein LY89DRAFT_747307 [Mollisia scopiformis]